MADFEERENRILDAAFDLITHYGYDKTPVSEIADEAGVSKGAIYLHFDSKIDLFDALLKREMDNYAEDWMCRVQADPDGGSIGSVYKHILAAINANPFMQAVFKQDRRILGKYLKTTDQVFNMRQAVETRAAFVQQMQAAGAVRDDVNPYTTAYLMSVFVNGITAMDDVVPDEDVPPFDELLSAMGDMMDSYLSRCGETDTETGKQVISDVMVTYRQLADNNERA